MAKNNKQKSRPTYKTQKDADILLNQQKEMEKVLQSKKSVTVPQGLFRCHTKT